MDSLKYMIQDKSHMCGKNNGNFLKNLFLAYIISLYKLKYF